MARELTDKQRSALEALRAAQAAGQGLCAYARAHGLNARQLHDAVAQLRRRGVLPPVQRAGQTPSAFVAVGVVDTPPTPRTGMICRVLHASGLPRLPPSVDPRAPDPVRAKARSRVT